MFLPCHPVGKNLADLTVQVNEGDVLGTSQSGTNKKIAFLNLARDIGLINRANRDAKNIVTHNLDLARQLIAGIDDIKVNFLKLKPLLATAWIQSCLGT